MNSRKLFFALFVVVAVLQLYVPAKMIFDREDVLATGKEYKFRTAPVDPNDPFRGKYITLDYEDNTAEVQNVEEWGADEPVYAILTTDADGFSLIQSVSKEKPSDSKDYVKAKVSFFNSTNNKLFIDYPFDRFYMEESKAYEAEQTYLISSRDTSQVTYALVNIKDGEAVLKDVLIDEVPIREIVKAAQEKRK